MLVLAVAVPGHHTGVTDAPGVEAEPCPRAWSLALRLGHLVSCSGPAWGRGCCTGGQPWLCLTASQPPRWE